MEKLADKPVADTFVIEGEHALTGSIQIHGSKNAALPIMAAALLTPEPLVIDNIPFVEDIRRMGDLLQSLGCEVTFDASRHRVTICAEHIDSHEVPVALGRAFRASFLVTGPLLTRTGAARAPHPGGCAIGKRPVNVDIKGFAATGAQVIVDGEFYDLRAARLHGERHYLDYPSHTGTENLLMAACLAKGRTVLKNASAEPEVVALAECLTRMGARIRGAGSSLIEVDGVPELFGIRVRVIPDRIESGTFAIAAAMTGGDVTLTDVDVNHMDPLTHKLREVGVRIEADEFERTYRIDARGAYLRPVEVQTLPYPGFPTDLQSAFTSLLTQADGTSIVHERVFENRLQYVSELQKLGARVQVTAQTATIEGPTRLIGAPVRALDIRAGAALILAGLCAEGRTEINDIYHIDRGYEDVGERLRALGARIERVSAAEEVVVAG